LVGVFFVPSIPLCLPNKDHPAFTLFNSEKAKQAQVGMELSSQPASYAFFHLCKTLTLPGLHLFLRVDSNPWKRPGCIDDLNADFFCETPCLKQLRNIFYTIRKKEDK
jgi:hypothetical protein